MLKRKNANNTLLERPALGIFSKVRKNLLIGCRVRCGGVSDRGAVYDELHAAISLTTVGGVVRCNGLRFSKAARGDGRRGHSLFGEKIAHRIRSALGKLLIEFIGAHTVGVAFNL
jgi:hypothetical protein